MAFGVSYPGPACQLRQVLGDSPTFLGHEALVRGTKRKDLVPWVDKFQPLTLFLCSSSLGRRGSPTASRRPLEPPPTGTGPPRTGYGPIRSKYVPLWSRLDVPPVTAASEQPQKACPYGCRRRHGAGDVNCMRARSIRIARLKGRIAVTARTRCPRPLYQRFNFLRVRQHLSSWTFLSASMADGAKVGGGRDVRMAAPQCLV